MKTTTALFTVAFVVLASSFASAEPSKKTAKAPVKQEQPVVITTTVPVRIPTLLERFAAADTGAQVKSSKTSSEQSDTTETGIVSTPQDAPDGQKVSLVVTTSKEGKPSGYATTATKMPIGRTHKSGRVLARR